MTLYESSDSLFAQKKPEKPRSRVALVLSVLGILVIVAGVALVGFGVVAHESPAAVTGEPLQGTIVGKNSGMSYTSDTCGFAFIEIDCTREASFHDLVVDAGGENTVDVAVDWSPYTFIPTTWRACTVGDTFRRDVDGQVSCTR